MAAKAPVCGMTVDPAKTLHHVEFEGHVHLSSVTVIGNSLRLRGMRL